MVKGIGKLVLVVLAMILLEPLSAFAANGLTTVVEVQAYPAGTAARFSAFTSNQCGGATFKVAGENPTANERAMHATLMTALVAGKQVWVATGGCDGPLEMIQFIGLYP